MGNIKTQTWDEIWNGPQADKIRNMVRNCARNCWMIGSAAPVIKKYRVESTKWVLKNKLRQLLGKKVCVS